MTKKELEKALEEKERECRVLQNMVMKLQDSFNSAQRTNELLTTALGKIAECKFESSVDILNLEDCSKTRAYCENLVVSTDRRITCTWKI